MSEPNIPADCLPSPELLRKFVKSLAHMRNNAHIYRHKRSTLSGTNSMQFMPYITKLMTSPAEGITIPRGEFPMCKLHTLYLKWMGALQWMIESAAAPEEHRNAAAVIRTSYVAREDKSGDCLRITPRTGSEQSTHKQASLAIKRVEKLRNDTPRVAWKADFIEWCESGEDGVPFIRKKLALDGDDIDFVRNISDQNGWSCIVNINEIRVLKG